MKKIIFLLIGFALIVSLVNMSWTDDSVKAKKFRKFMINEEHEVNWLLTYGTSDTSVTFLSNAVMTLFGVAYDGVDGDSSHFKLHLDCKGVDGWISDVKTKTITEDSTEFSWELTATYMPSADSLRLRIEPLADCRRSDITIKIEFRGCEAAINY